MNDIAYTDSQNREHTLSVLECLETRWVDGQPSTTRFKWASNLTVTPHTVTALTNEGGRLLYLACRAVWLRPRWSIAVRHLLESLPCAAGCAHLCEAPSRRILQRCQVIITIDNGITAHAAVERAQELGLETLIIDHHLLRPDIGAPRTIYIDPPDNVLSASQVGYLAAQALRQTWWGEASHDDGGLAIAAVGAQMDWMPLDVAENRGWIAHAQQVINSPACQGGLALRHRPADANRAWTRPYPSAAVHRFSLWRPDSRRAREASRRPPT